jgi:hypothetical protein
VEVDGERQEEPDHDMEDDRRAGGPPVRDLPRGHPETRRIGEQNENQPPLVPRAQQDHGDGPHQPEDDGDDGERPHSGQEGVRIRMRMDVQGEGQDLALTLDADRHDPIRADAREQLDGAVVLPAVEIDLTQGEKPIADLQARRVPGTGGGGDHLPGGAERKGQLREDRGVGVIDADEQQGKRHRSPQQIRLERANPRLDRVEFHKAGRRSLHQAHHRAPHPRRPPCPTCR